MSFGSGYKKPMHCLPIVPVRVVHTVLHNGK